MMYRGSEDTERLLLFVKYSVKRGRRKEKWRILHFSFIILNNYYRKT